MGFLHILDRGIIAGIRVLPGRAMEPAFRIYNSGLKATGRSFRATTYFGASVTCNATDLLQMMILHFGHWEPTISRLLEKLLRPGDTFIDVGANIGYDALLGSYLVGSSGRVVSVEANPPTFRALQANLRANGAGNVRAVNVAASDKTGELQLYDRSGPRNTGAVTTLAPEGMPAVATVEARPLKLILSPEERASARLIKIDVEGAEPPILNTILDDLDSYDPRLELIVEVSPGEDRAIWRGLFDRLKAAQFAAYKVENSYRPGWYLKWRRPAPLEPITSLPERMTDIFFTRRSASALAADGIVIAG
jgi:FkbM family methyltransferase